MYLDSLVQSIFRVTGWEICDEQAEELLQVLSGREKDIIIRRWGLVDGKSEPTKKVAALHNLSGNRVRQIEAKAHRKLCSALKVQAETAGKDILDQPVEVLNLSTRTLNCLKRDLRVTVRGLTEATAYDLLYIRNFGERCLAEIREKIASVNLKLKEE